METTCEVMCGACGSSYRARVADYGNVSCPVCPVLERRPADVLADAATLDGFRSRSAGSSRAEVSAAVRALRTPMNYSRREHLIAGAVLQLAGADPVPGPGDVDMLETCGACGEAACFHHPTDNACPDGLELSGGVA